MVCPQNGTAVLKGLSEEGVRKSRVNLPYLYHRPRPELAVDGSFECIGFFFPVWPPSSRDSDGNALVQQRDCLVGAPV